MDLAQDVLHERVVIRPQHLLALLSLLVPVIAAAQPRVVIARDREGVLRRYILGDPLGKPGAGGEVFAAVETTTGQRVAIKEAHDGDIHRRLLRREAALLKRLDGNPRFPAYFGRGHREEDPKRTAIVMELVPGAPSASTPATRADPCKAVRMAIRKLDGLIALNAFGRRHGDLRKENVMVDLDQSDSVKINDLGGAMKISARYPWGGPQYYAPEQTKALPSGGRANGDVYSIGVQQLEAITGMEAPEPSTEQLAAVKNAALRAVIVRAIEPDPALHYQRAEDLVTALRPFESHVP